MSWFAGAAAKAGQGFAKDQMTPERQVQAMKMGAQAVPGGQQFQFFPTQVGGPTPYARSRKPVFAAICVFQAFMAAMALVEFANFLSGIIMILGLMVGFWAFKEDMNITYICWWGVLCVAGFIAGVVGALIGFAFTIATIIAKFNIPLSCFFGMCLAWNYYVDYEEQHHCTDTVGSWLRALRLLKERPPTPPQSQQNIMPGMPAGLAAPSWLPQFGGNMAQSAQFGGGNMAESAKFGNSGFDSMKMQAGAYGAQAGAFGAQAGSQAGAYGAQAGSQAGAYGAQAGSYGAMGKDQMAGYGAQMQAARGGAEGQASSFAGGLFGQANAAQGQASNFGTGLFGQAAQMGANAPQMPEGRVDTKRDPFMTL